ncbi:MAG: hypothetical protein WBE98_11520 [Gammaproteobacteria bacterium]
MRTKQKLVALMGLTASSTVLAAEVEIPHQFEAGTPAVAEEINENFSALAESIELLSEALVELESQVENEGGALSVYVDGARVGTFLAPLGVKQLHILDPAQPPTLGNTLEFVASESVANAHALEALSDKGYLFRVATDPMLEEGTLMPASFIYLDAQCAGTPYLQVRLPTDLLRGVSMLNPWVLNQGIVVGGVPGNPDREYYVPAGAQAQEFQFTQAYVLHPLVNMCFPYDPVPVIKLVEIFPNDPSVTGVPNGLSGKVTIGR